MRRYIGLAIGVACVLAIASPVEAGFGYDPVSSAEICYQALWEDDDVERPAVIMP